MRGRERVIDVIVIGGGPAGLAAALCLGRARRSVLVIDRGAPRHAVAEGVHNFLTRDGMKPSALRAAAWEQMHELTSVSRHDGTVVSLVRRDDHWLAAGDDGQSWGADAVLLATGVVDQHPEIPGYEALWGRSIFHCPYCHGWEVRDQPLGVLGSIAGSVQHALLVRQWSDDVIFFAHSYDLSVDERHQLNARGIGIEEGVVTKLVVEDDHLRGVALADGRTVERSAVFVRPGNVPHDDGLAAALGCETDDAGFVTVDATGRTSYPGMWAAGNVVEPRAQVITSAGAGSAAAIAINADLVQHDVDIALHSDALNTPV